MAHLDGYLGPGEVPKLLGPGEVLNLFPEVAHLVGVQGPGGEVPQQPGPGEVLNLVPETHLVVVLGPGEVPQFLSPGEVLNLYLIPEVHLGPGEVLNLDPETHLVGVLVPEAHLVEVLAPGGVPVTYLGGVLLVPWVPWVHHDLVAEFLGC